MHKSIIVTAVDQIKLLVRTLQHSKHFIPYRNGFIRIARLINNYIVECLRSMHGFGTDFLIILHNCICLKM